MITLCNDKTKKEKKKTKKKKKTMKMVKQCGDNTMKVELYKTTKWRNDEMAK